jgi:hypothetical protein
MEQKGEMLEIIKPMQKLESKFSTEFHSMVFPPH